MASAAAGVFLMVTLARVFLMMTLATGYTPAGWLPAQRSGTTLRRHKVLRPTTFPSRVVRMRMSEDDKEEEKADVDAVVNDEDDAEKKEKEMADLTKQIQRSEQDLERVREGILEAEKQRAEEKAEWEPRMEMLRDQFVKVKERQNVALDRASATQRIAILKDIIPICDTLYYGLALVSPKTPGEIALADKYKALIQTLDDCFTSLGVTVIADTNVPFDPALHQAADSEFDTTVPKDHVINVLQKGYKLGDVLIRPAVVSVSM